MKKLVIILFISSIIGLQSCGHEQPVFNDPDQPFIVTKIESRENGYSLYYSNKQNNYYPPGIMAHVMPIIEAPNNLYKIGDTIKLK